MRRCIADLGLGADAPAPADRQRHLGLVVVADGGQRDDRDLGAGGAPEPGEQVVQLRARRGVDQRREVVDVADGLRREEPLDLRALRQRRRRPSVEAPPGGR